ncbi:MAG: hypothetical protein Q8O99_05095 [bacterium]|nr:hypothetical protein [bacterium]
MHHSRTGNRGDPGFRTMRANAPVFVDEEQVSGDNFKQRSEIVAEYL